MNRHRQSRRPQAAAPHVLALAGILFASPLDAQAIEELHAGARVRVTTSRETSPLVGTLLSATPDAVVIRSADREFDLALPAASVRKLERSLGPIPDGERFVEGAKIGALAGLTVGVVATSIVYLSDADESCGEVCFHPTTVAAVSGVALTGLSALAGGLVGLIVRRERWKEVPLEPR